jgi:serine phosphatase RsbU (regulator of sigma subunit)
MPSGGIRRTIATLATTSLIILCYIPLLFTGCVGSDDHAESSLTVDISGTWKMMRGNNSQYAESNFDDDSWPSIVLPAKRLMPSQTLNHFNESRSSVDMHKGFMWFRKEVTLEVVPENSMLLQVGEIMNADRVFVNGVSIGESGRFPPDFKSAWCRFRSYPIPIHVLKEGKNSIAMQVYFNSEAWVTGPMRIIDRNSGISEKVVNDLFKINLMHGISYMLIAITLLFFLLYVWRREEVTYLYFSICTLFLTLLLGLQYWENMYPDVNISSNTIFKVTQTGLIFFAPALAIFFRSFVLKHVKKTRVFLYYLPPLVLWILVVMADERYQILQWRNYALLLIPFYCIDFLLISFEQVLKRNRRAWFVFLGILPLVILGIHDILAFSLHMIESSIALFVYGIPLLIATMAAQLAGRFVESLNESEKLNTTLREMLNDSKRLAAIEKELDLARKIQMSSIPRQLPKLRGFDIAASYIPMDSIGGDFYNVHVVDENRLGVLITDVSGHGIPAALIASMLRVTFDTLQSDIDSPDRFMVRLNDIIIKYISDHFLTAGCMFIDKSEGVARYVSAGHEPLIHHKQYSNHIDVYQPRGRAIGLQPEIAVEISTIPIRPGERLILYTDCIVEAYNHKEQRMFGARSFHDIIRDSAELSAGDFCDSLVNRLRSFTSMQDSIEGFEDDLTLVVVDIV